MCVVVDEGFENSVAKLVVVYSAVSTFYTSNWILGIGKISGIKKKFFTVAVNWKFVDSNLEVSLNSKPWQKKSIEGIWNRYQGGWIFCVPSSTAAHWFIFNIGLIYLRFDQGQKMDPKATGGFGEIRGSTPQSFFRDWWQS